MKITIGILGGDMDVERQASGVAIYNLEEALQCDIVVFTGGADVHPAIYHDVDRYCMGTDLQRDMNERDILLECIERGVKVLGYCRGHQFINACLGGTLIQDIRMETGSDHTPADHRIGPGFAEWQNQSLAKLFPRINTYHHQSVKVPGKGQDVILRAMDDIIEATANEAGSIVTFQFHPEWNNIGADYFRKIADTGKLIW